MKKGIFVLMMAALAACSSENDVVPAGETAGTVVTFRVSSGDAWDVTRALTANGNALTDMWIYDYVGYECVQVVQLNSNDDDLAAPSITLDLGTHKISIVASNGGTAAANGSFVTWSRPGDTFWAEKTVTIADGTSAAADVAVTLARVATRLRVSVTDEVPTGTASLTIQAAQWWSGVDVTSGGAYSQAAYSSTANIPQSYIGTTGQLAMSMYGMSDGDEWMTDITVTAKDAQGASLGTVTVKDVPFVRNRVTKISGKLFSGDRGFAVTVNDAWSDEYALSW